MLCCCNLRIKRNEKRENDGERKVTVYISFYLNTKLSKVLR